MSDPSIQLRCANDHVMARGSDWCGTCGEPPAKASHARDRDGRPIGIGDRVSWRGQIFTIKAVSVIGSLGFEEPLRREDFDSLRQLPNARDVTRVSAASRNICRWCGDDCPRWGNDVCPLRPRQIPRGAAEAK